MLLLPGWSLAQEQHKQPRQRAFLFTYGATIAKLKPGQAVRIWVPVPPSNADQQVQLAFARWPASVQKTTEEKFGNAMYYCAARADSVGTLSFAVTYRVQRQEVHGKEQKVVNDAPLNPLFLQGTARVPIKGKPLVLLQQKELPREPYPLGKALFDLVNEHMSYSKHGEGWGQGDAVWACDSKYGNCTDFHSLFLSLARSQQLPAKFEIGFALPEKRGRGEIAGYHCWASFLPKGHGWIPVDISQAKQVRARDPQLAEYCFGNLTENRLLFSTGRDIDLSPKQAGPPLNFFIYPHVEVEDKALPAEQIQQRFLYQDLDYKPASAK
jgi:hypothetical protein